MRKQFRILPAVACAIAIAAPAGISLQAGNPPALQSGASATERAAPIEQGKFRLHKFEQPIGEETYQFTEDGDSLVVKMDFKFTDRGTDVPLSATFRAAPDLTPESFVIKGKTSRSSTIDEDVEVFPGKIRLRDRDRSTEIVPPKQFFTIAGYAPSTMQMLLVRYWATHNSPAELETLPGGHVKITMQGKDSVFIYGQPQVLQRYTVEGLIWGRETLWLDSHRDLIAAITTDAEFDHFEAVREGYESALGSFVSRAGADGMAALADLSQGIAGSQAGAGSGALALVGGTLVDGTGSAPVPDAAVVIRKGRILAVGPKSQIKIPKHAQIVDVRGKTILPGLWDMHAHFEQVEWGPIYLAAAPLRCAIAGTSLNSSPPFATPLLRARASDRASWPLVLWTAPVRSRSALHGWTPRRRLAAGWIATTRPASSR